MRIVTWNINSVRLRLPLVKHLTDTLKPDVLCLQETKAQNHHFPLDDLMSMGYTDCFFEGEKSYNGVAILSTLPLQRHEEKFWAGEEQKRHLSCTLPGDIELHNFYVPAGGDIPDRDVNKAYGYKLDYLDHMTEWFKEHRTQNDKMILVGDLNVAPLEQDVWSHKQLINVVSHTDAERTRFRKLMESCDWLDTPRLFVPETEKLYSWWSYRNRDWKKSNRGRRLDHILATPALRDVIQDATMLNEARDFEKPSDHVPVILDINM